MYEETKAERLSNLPRIIKGQRETKTFEYLDDFRCSVPSDHAVF
jgi:hypothetical protein